MRLGLFITATTVAIALGGCSNQKTYGGPVVPIYTAPITASAPIMATTRYQPCKPNCPCARRRVRVRRGSQTLRHSGYSSGFRYPNVPTDPVPYGQPANTERDIGRQAKATAAGEGGAGRGGQVSGHWTVQGAAGCSLWLSQKSLLDLKRASSVGCATDSIGNITGWKTTGKTVELYQPGAKPPARFTIGQDGSLEGEPGGSAAGIRLNRAP